MSRPRSNSIAPNSKATAQARTRPASASGTGFRILGRSAGAHRPPAGAGRQRINAVALGAALEHAAAVGQLGDEAEAVAGHLALLDAHRAAGGGDGAAQLLVALLQLEPVRPALDGQRPAAGEASGHHPK